MDLLVYLAIVVLRNPLIRLFALEHQHIKLLAHLMVPCLDNSTYHRNHPSISWDLHQPP